MLTASVGLTGKFMVVGVLVGCSVTLKALLLLALLFLAAMSPWTQLWNSSSEIRPFK
jgi:hypothetical protein